MSRLVLVGQPLSRYLKAEDKYIFQRHIEQYFESGATQVCEVLLMPAGRPPLWARLESPAAPRADVLPGLCRLVHSDITERKRVEEALQKAHDELAQLVAERTEELMWASEKLRAEITERKQAEEALKERLQFEQLLSGLSARFVITPPDRVNSEIEYGLRQILEFLQVDHCALIRTLPGKASYQITHIASLVD